MLVRMGWQFSWKKRHGYWHQEPDKQEVVELLRNLGYGDAQPLPSGTDGEDDEDTGYSNGTTSEDKRVAEDLDEAVVQAIIDSGQTPPYKKNKAGLWMVTETGKLAAKADVAAWLDSLDVQADAGESGAIVAPKQQVMSYRAPEPKVTHRRPTEDADRLAYDAGYEDGQFDGNDPSVPAMRSRNDMAKYKGITVMRLNELAPNAWFHGYLQGFEDARPAPVEKQRGLRGLGA